jgi:uracil-DNA glycosylase
MQVPNLRHEPTRDEAPTLPPYLSHAPKLLTTGDMAMAIGTSPDWVLTLVRRGEIHPCNHTCHWRHRQWEFFPLFHPSERDRVVAERSAAGKVRPQLARAPQQLTLLLPIDGGRR